MESDVRKKEAEENAIAEIAGTSDNNTNKGKKIWIENRPDNTQKFSLHYTPAAYFYFKNQILRKENVGGETKTIKYNYTHLSYYRLQECYHQVRWKT